MIAAASRNNVIGVEGRMPWHISEDLRRFKRLTMGHPVIMGRKTYDSLSKPLPGRLNVVLSHRPINNPQVYVAQSLPDILQSLEQKIPYRENIDYTTAFIIGGESVYREGLSLAHRLELTRLDRDAVGDAYLPDLNLHFWQEQSKEDHDWYSFITYVRK